MREHCEGNGNNTPAYLGSFPLLLRTRDSTHSVGHSLFLKLWHQCMQQNVSEDGHGEDVQIPQQRVAPTSSMCLRAGRGEGLTA